MHQGKIARSGTLLLTGAGPGIAPAIGYQGPGSIVSGAQAWWSCTYAYSTSYVGSLCNVCLPADVTCADITQSNGVAVVPAGLSTCNITTVLCTVKTAFDQSGAAACGGACDITQATEANRWTFIAAIAANGCPVTSLPCIKNGGTGHRLSNATGMTLGNPLTLVALATRTGATTANNAVLAGSGNNKPFFGWTTSTNTGQMFNGGGGTCTASVSDNAWHVLIGQLNGNGALSSIYVDNANTACSGGTTPGTSGFSAGTIAVGTEGNGSSSPCSCNYGEIGFWNVSMNSTQAGNLYTNIKTTRWGF